MFIVYLLPIITVIRKKVKNLYLQKGKASFDLPFLLWLEAC